MAEENKGELKEIIISEKEIKKEISVDREKEFLDVLKMFAPGTGLPFKSTRPLTPVNTTPSNVKSMLGRSSAAEIVMVAPAKGNTSPA